MRLIRQIVEARDADVAGAGLRELFESSGRELISRLKFSPHDGVALRAAWEEVLLEARVKRDHDEWAQERRVFLAKYVGFVEGRLGVSPPDFWIHGAMRRLRAGATYEPLDNVVHEVRFGTDKITVPVGQALHVVGDQALFRDGNQTAVLPPDLFTRPDAPVVGRLSGLIDENRCYLATSGMLQSAYPLTCNDRNTGKRLWTATVWANSFTGGFSGGAGHNFVTLRRVNDTVIVFGDGIFCFYVEGFDWKSGEPRFRFSSKYHAE